MIILKIHWEISAKHEECVLSQLCLTLFDPMDYSLPGSFIPGISQVSIKNTGVDNYNFYVFLLDWTLDHYVVTFLISYNLLYFKVYFVWFEDCYSRFLLLPICMEYIFTSSHFQSIYVFRSEVVSCREHTYGHQGGRAGVGWTGRLGLTYIHCGHWQIYTVDTIYKIDN